METPETEGFPPEEQDQEDTGADPPADAATLDQEEVERREREAEERDEELEDRGDV